MKNNPKIHKYRFKDDCVLIDINSGAVHLVDEAVFDIMDIFDGVNDAAVIDALRNKYPRADIEEVLGELHELIDNKLLFAPDIEVPLVFKDKGVVKSLCLMVAHDCNLRCRYCFADTGEYSGVRQLMSEAVGRAAVDFLVKESPQRIHHEIDFFGGEPLMNMPTVRAVTQYVHEIEEQTGKLFKLTLTTNGLLLNDENRKWLDENNFSLVLSLDGRRETHDRMRPDAGGNGTYERCLKNFQKAVESRQHENYFLRGTYTAYNLDFTNDVIAMNDAGFDILSIEPVVARDAPYAITEEQLPRIFAEYDRLTETYLERKREGKGFFFFHFNMDLSNGPCVVKRLAGCGAGHEYFAVAADGGLYPCHQFVGREKYRLGSVFTGVENNALPQKFRQNHVLNKPKCAACWARFFCSGGCHANAEEFSGDIYEPYAIGCEIQKKRLECAIYVQAVLAAKSN